MKFSASAKSSVPLIKHLGFANDGLNTPINSALMLSIPHLCAHATIQISQSNTSQVFINNGTEEDLQEYLACIASIKQRFNYQGEFIAEIKHNIPTNSGLDAKGPIYASLVKGLCLAITTTKTKPMLENAELSLLSRQFNHTSSASFFEPWTICRADKMLPVTSALPHLKIAVILSNDKSKINEPLHLLDLKQTSPAIQTKIQKADRKIHKTIKCISSKKWYNVYCLLKEEIFEIQDIINAANLPIQYLNSEAIELINLVDEFWKANIHGPMITMDNNRNFYLLYDNNSENKTPDLIEELKQKYEII